MTIDLFLSTFRILTTSTFSGVLFGLMFLIFGLQLLRKKVVTPAYSRRLFLWFLVIMLVQLALVFADLWFEWHRPSCGTSCLYFFPPNSNYYLNQVIVKWTGTLAFNAVVGLAGGLIFLWFSKHTQGRIIDQLDVDLLTVGGMVAGWPNILVFYAIAFVLTIGLTIVRAIVERSATTRMVITPILPMACAVIAVYGDQLARIFHLYEIGLTTL